MTDEYEDSEIEGALGEIGETSVEYPPHLLTARRAEFRTQVRTMKKKKGCPLMALIVVGIPGSILATFLYWITHL